MNLLGRLVGRRLPILHALDSVRKRFVGLAIHQTLLLEDYWVSLLCLHCFNLILVLVLLGLLAHLEEVRVEDLVRVQRVRVWVVLLVV